MTLRIFRLLIGVSLLLSALYGFAQDEDSDDSYMEDLLLVKGDSLMDIELWERTVRL